MIRLLRALSLTLLLAVTPVVHGQSATIEETLPDPIHAQLITEDNSISAGHPFWVALNFQIENGWHLYWKNPGTAGIAPTIKWDLPSGFIVDAVEWPTPLLLESNAHSQAYGYEHEVMLLARVIPPQELNQNQKWTLAADIHWVACSDVQCLPGQAGLSTQITTQESASKPSQDKAALFAKARSKLPTPFVNISAVRSGGDLLTLKIPEQETREIVQVTFYPEIKGQINPSRNPLLVKGNDTSSIILIEHPETQHSSLKGVLVLAEKQGSRIVEHAYDINAPITGKNDTATAFADLSLNTPALEELPPAPRETDYSEFALAMVFAFIGGMILNLMPCVLPVISFKILSFVKLSGEDKSSSLRHGLSFSAGVLASFWALAAILLVFQAFGKSVGWGFQLQQPIFVAALASLILLFALSLFGVFELGTMVTSWAGQAEVKSQRKQGLGASFFSGILATALATPCTGPFLGSAIGLAFTMPPILAILIFTSLGLGMAFPYLLLAANPALLRFMPKPGNWMITFKQVMGFIMLATVLWLLWVFAAQTSSIAVVLLLGAFFFLALGGWIYGSWGSAHHSRRSRWLSLPWVGLCLLGSIYIADIAISIPADSTPGSAQTGYLADEWEPFSPQRVAELRQKGIPVFIDFTAKWCLICQANHLVLTRDHVQQGFKKHGVVKMKADWTLNDPVITEELRKFDRSGVPLYILYGKDPVADAYVLPQVLTPDTVLEHLENMAAPKQEV